MKDPAGPTPQAEPEQEAGKGLDSSGGTCTPRQAAQGQETWPGPACRAGLGYCLGVGPGCLWPMSHEEKGETDPNQAAAPAATAVPWPVAAVLVRAGRSVPPSSAARAPAGWTASPGGEWAHSPGPNAFQEASVRPRGGAPPSSAHLVPRGRLWTLTYPTPDQGPVAPSVILYLFNIQLAVQGARAALGSAPVPPGCGWLPPPATALVQGATI